MTIAEISTQQLDAPRVGMESWGDGYGRAAGEWLRSMGFVENRGDDYLPTSEGWQFVEVAVEDWADTVDTSNVWTGIVRRRVRNDNPCSGG